MAELIPKFCPTPEQEDVRELVRELIDDDSRTNLLVADWVKEIDFFTFEMWEDWQLIDGFSVWWLQAIPEHKGLMPADIRMLEYQAVRALMVGLRSDDPAAIRAALSLANNANNTNDVVDDGVNDWFSAGSDAKAWSIPDKSKDK